MKQKIEGGKTTANFVQVGGRCCKKCEKIITATTTNSEDNKKTEIKFPQCSNIVCECHTVKATTKPQKIEGGKELVLVNWTDSVRDDNSWVYVANEDFDDFPAKLEHESVGWIIKDTKDYLSLAHSRSAFVYDDGDNSVIRSLTIPKCAIRKITPIYFGKGSFVIKNSKPL